MKKVVTITILAAFCVGATVWAAGDPAAKAKMCPMCHAPGKAGPDLKVKCANQDTVIKKLMGTEHKGPKGLTEAEAKEVAKHACAH